MNILDLIKNKDGYFYKAHYRRYKDSPPQYFTFKEVTYPSERYGSIITNLMTVENSMVISTTWNCGFVVNGFISTQDGSLWQIKDVQKDCKNSRSTILLRDGTKCEFIIGLIKIDNPMGLK